jgi:hypothetical protein
MESMIELSQLLCSVENQHSRFMRGCAQYPTAFNPKYLDIGPFQVLMPVGIEHAVAEIRAREQGGNADMDDVCFGHHSDTCHYLGNTARLDISEYSEIIRFTASSGV